MEIVIKSRNIGETKHQLEQLTNLINSGNIDVNALKGCTNLFDTITRNEDFFEWFVSLVECENKKNIIRDLAKQANNL